MGVEGNIKEAHRWINQAKDDINAGEILGENNKYAQACFLCQQAGEKALKALWFYFDEDPWGHSIYRLIEELPQKAKYKELDQLKESALLLDRLYIPTRYPNGLPGLTPMEAYNKLDVNGSLKAGKFIIERIESIINVIPAPD